MRVLLHVVTGLVVLAAAIVVLAPAALLDAPLAARTRERLHLVDTQGVWWHGRGVVSTTDGRTRLPLAWRVAFAPLFTGSLVVELGTRADAALPTGTLLLRDGSVAVRDLHVVAPAMLVTALVPDLASVALRGDLDVRAPSFTWRAGTAGGAFDATWQQASVIAGGFAVDLGSVSAKGTPLPDGVAATLRNTGGDLAIGGSVAARGGLVDASLELTPTSVAPQPLRAMLPLLGHSDASGRVRVGWRSDHR